VKPPDTHFGTREAHLKRYLKPLLQQRRDLVQIGRRLLIRPVRHLMRGVLFDRTGDKYVFRLYPHVDALYAPHGGAGYVGDYLRDYTCEVWQPHFQALLIDQLPENVLTDIGTVTTLDQLLERAIRMHYEAFVRTLVLAGRQDEAVAIVREREQNPRSQSDAMRAKALREFILRDINTICADARAVEADVAKKLELTEIWEPSPFPAELPAARRPGRSAEPVFLTTPWPERPPWLLQPMPDQPGDVRYAKDILERNDRASLLVPLAREEAKARHEHFEDYVLTARTTDDRLLTLGRRTAAIDRCNPVYAKTRKRVWSVYLRVQAHEHRLHVRFDLDGPDVLILDTLIVFVGGWQRQLWGYGVERDGWIRAGYISEANHERRLPTDAEIELLTCPMPAFGEFETIVAQMLALLRIAGFGEFT
jgi:hypothetical protein